MALPKRFASDPEGYKNYLRRLKNFKDYSEEKLDEYVKAKVEGRSSTEALNELKYRDAEEGLPEDAKAEFRRRVKLYLGELKKTATDQVYLHLVQLFVRTELAYLYALNSSDVKPGDLHKLVMALTNFADALGLTNRERRLGNVKTDESILEALAKSNVRVKEEVASRTNQDTKEQELFGDL